MTKFWLSERMLSRVFWEELKFSIFYEEAASDAKKCGGYGTKSE